MYIYKNDIIWYDILKKRDDTIWKIHKYDMVGYKNNEIRYKNMKLYWYDTTQYDTKVWYNTYVKLYKHMMTYEILLYNL
jgi:hypothetical protein